MYEGVTEYFANLSKSRLITEEDFITAFQTKWSASMNDTMSFTTMSANVLKQPYKDQYINVYQRVIDRNVFDIIIREKSKGEKGILDLMQNLLMNMVFQNHLMIMNFC
jgi:predicted metalloprotease with PDZ domain